MKELFDDPGRFEFFQAVRQVERVLAAAGVDTGTAVRKHVRFPNSTSLAFAAGEVESLALDCESALSIRELVAGTVRSDVPQIRITPTFIGMLGIHGTLPLHYTEVIHAYAADGRKEARLAFLDALSSRLVSLFYEAWKAQRHELARDDETAAIGPRLRALSSAQHSEGGTTHAQKLETYFAGLLRHRPVSAAAIENILSHYFDMAVEVQTGVPTRHPVPPPCQAQLGTSALSEDVPCVLGSHMHRRDMRSTISLHPQTRERALEFCRSGPGAQELREVLRLFAVSTIEFEIRVVVEKEQVSGVRLDGTGTLGQDCYVLSEPALEDRADMRYLVRTM